MSVLNSFVMYFTFTHLVRTLRAGLHGFPGAWRRCNYKRREWSNHSSSLRLALRPENRTRQPVQQEKRKPWRALLIDGNPSVLVDVKKIVPGNYIPIRTRQLSIEEIFKLKQIFDSTALKSEHLISRILIETVYCKQRVASLLTSAAGF